MEVSPRLIPCFDSPEHLSTFSTTLPDLPFLEFGRSSEAAKRPGADEPGQPPGSGITGGSNRKCDSKSLEIGGLDWFEVSLWANWDLTKLNELTAKLARAKSSGVAFDASTEFERPGGEVVTVEPSGRRLGPIYADYVVSTDGLQLAIVNQAVPDQSRPNLFLTIGSIPLMSAGIKVLLEGLAKLAEEWGFNIERSSVSRIDLCVDLPGVDMAWFAKPFLNDQYICRAQIDQINRRHRKVTGFTIGRGDILCRIYDKVLELNGQTLKQEVICEARYLGTPCIATRVEFQLRTKAIKEKCGGENTIEAVLSKLGSLANYLTTDWIRFTQDVPDRENNHQHLAKISDLWKVTQAAFAIAFPIEIPRGERKKYRPFSPLLVKQAVGCIRSAAAACGIAFGGREEFLKTMNYLVGLVVEDWKTEGIKWERRTQKIAALLPLETPGVSDLSELLKPTENRWQERYEQWKRTEDISSNEAHQLQDQAALGLALETWGRDPQQGAFAF